jgi:hypothetical protein
MNFGVSALAGFCISKRFALLAALVLIAAGFVLLVTGSLGWALAVGYPGMLLLILVWNHCAAELNRDVDKERVDGQ